MRNHKSRLILLSLLFLIFGGCDELPDREKYQRPDWLPGKLFTTVSVQEDLTMYTECLQLTGLDTIIDVSGSWTVFAPTNDAMKQYLLANGYADLSSIPLEELKKITKFHIIQFPWSLDQLKSLGVDGWKTTEDGNSNPYAYKHETILKNPDEKYWIKRASGKEIILMDSIKAGSSKKVFVPSRKYLPNYYDDFMTKNGITSVDFNFYFDRPIEPKNVYYAGAKIIKADIMAENGFVHKIDRVVEPMLNAKEMLEKKWAQESYKLFLEMIYWYYPDFEPNFTATYNQPDAKRGGLVDTLWDLNYSVLAFDLHRERFDVINQTLIRHNGLIAPTDESFRKFIDNILTSKSGFPHWSDYKSLPNDVVDLIVAQNFKSSPIYPSTSQYQKIFKGANRYHQDEKSIVRKDFGSNCTFIGIDNYIPDRVFTSVTSPVFCRPGFSIFRRAMVYSGVLDAIANHKGKLYFFPITDFSLMADSSLMLNWIDEEKNTFNFMTYNRMKHQMENLGSTTLKNWILNQVGTSVGEISAGKEIIRTLGGRTLTWDHSTNIIQGTYPSTFGYKGLLEVINTPFPLDEPTDNGKSLTVKSWFNFGN
ncbi:MAG: fasciclin domain-containing protein [Prolixibacteraceae bacterium]|nr:fasciclin domain-containing protein [Prolixibacteraceae bacterium]